MSLDLWLTPDVCPHCGRGGERVFEENYTHNVVLMWRLAGCFDALYESDGKRAGDVVEACTTALRAMRDNPSTFEAWNPKNGWGKLSGSASISHALYCGV